MVGFLKFLSYFFYVLAAIMGLMFALPFAGVFGLLGIFCGMLSDRVKLGHW